MLCLYENQPTALQQLRSSVRSQLAALDNEIPFEQLSPEQLASLDAFIGPEKNSEEISPREGLARIRELLAQYGNLEGGKLDEAIKAVLNPIIESGVLTELAHRPDEGDQSSIVVLPDRVFVEVSKVRRSEIVAALPQRVSEKFQQIFNNPDALIVARLVSNYLVEKMPESTLTYDRDLSEEARRKAEESVEDAVISYKPGVNLLATAGEPITRLDELPVLRAEYDAWVSIISWSETGLRLLAFAGMIAAFYLLCGLFIHFQHDRRVITDPRQLLRLLGTVVVTCFLCAYTSADPMRAEVIGLVLCAMTLTIAFDREVALLVTNCLALTITLGLGLDIGEFVTLCSGICAASLLLGRIRTRTKLIYVGLASAVVVTLTHLGVDTVMGKLHAVDGVPEFANAITTNWKNLLPGLMVESLRLGAFTLLAAALMTGLLPFAERIYGVQTDLSLLELGDASHPLLRQLAQRAPGTYNHSINVAAIAESAADKIGRTACSRAWALISMTSARCSSPITSLRTKTKAVIVMKLCNRR